MQRAVTLALIAALLGACGGPPRPAPEQGQFDPQTRGDLRLFTYRERLRIPKAKPVTTVVDPRAEAARMAKYLPGEQLKQAEHRLRQDSRLQAFCPLGYVAIDKYSVLNEIVIRGECKYRDEMAGSGG